MLEKHAIDKLLTVEELESTKSEKQLNYINWNKFQRLSKYKFNEILSAFDELQ